MALVSTIEDILHPVSMAQVQWSDLPVEILLIIFQNLKDPFDVYRCGLVCVSWKSVVTTILPPFLLLSNVGGFSDNMTSFHFEASLNKQSCSLFNTQTNETHEIFLPEVEKCWFSGSSFGWLITICLEPPHEVHLLNPLTRDRIQLPAARQLRLRSDLRVITSASPLNPTCLVLAINYLKGALAFCRPGDKSWTLFEDFCRRLDDVVHYKGEFYAVNSLGHLYHLHCNTPATQKVLPLCPIEFLQDEPLHRNYLVELDGKLLLVVRYMHMPFSSYFTYEFEVYELNRVEKVWIKVINISNNAILLGTGSSISLPVSYFRNFEVNCIYFIDDNIKDIYFRSLRVVRNTGSYNMATGQIEYLYESSLIRSSPLNWFVPEVICRKKKGKMKSWPSMIWRSLLNWYTPKI
ncbi:hypothetical protein EZV62_008811 [Acer yangbiense]|uniref:F-box domain-containing protein n=1 Tax=Acer yangbiense TaxID=1000413 RepID=A0A5C7IGF6_9ROSI|nr:hypothetical protein EZV62_008811 [Acer yangbiense]